MGKNVIRKYAVWARRELILRVAGKALQYGISEKEMVAVDADSVNGIILTQTEKNQRKALISSINEKGFSQVMEEVAYTWFNRFCALRFMEVNGYLPSHVRVFTDEQNNFKPQILSEAIHLEMEGLDINRVYEYKEADQTEELYKYLLITQCNALNQILPGMFQSIDDYTEMLLPDNLLREGSVIEQMITIIPEDEWKDAVQIIGWLYQYYNSELKEQVFADLKKNIKISRENIPAATQLFTPNWIVRYMVENTLGRLWLEGHPDEELKAGWKYYLDDAQQDTGVQAQLDKIRDRFRSIRPEEIRCIDPCMGSGHILVDMFDVLMSIYESYGYNQRDAARKIIENNLYGLDIDERAAQLANFAVMMKARQYDRRFFNRVVQPHVYSISESNHLDKACVEYFANGDAQLQREIRVLLDELHDAKEYGTILKISQVDFDAIYARFDEINEDINTMREITLRELLPFVQAAQVMAQKYHVVVTNPPYMGISNGNRKLVKYVRDHYPNSKADLFSVFVECCGRMTENSCYYAMIIQPSFISLASFEKQRRAMLSKHSIHSMIHMGRGIFGIDFGSMAFVVSKRRLPGFTGRYFKLHKRTFQYIEPDDIEKLFLLGARKKMLCCDFNRYDTQTGISDDLFGSGTKIHYETKQLNFEKIPGSPVGYWISDALIHTFSNELLGKWLITREGMATAGNERYLRYWFEVRFSAIQFNCNHQDEAAKSNMKWFPYNKGGNFRKWYGNNEFVVDWQNNGFAIKNNRDKKNGRVRSHNYNGAFAFRKGITWSSISAGDISARFTEKGFLFDSKGAKGFCENEENLYPILALINSVTAKTYLEIFSPTMDFKVGDISKIPLHQDVLLNPELTAKTRQLLELSKADWNSFEISWDFKFHPLIRRGLISDAYQAWAAECNDRFDKMKLYEEEINRIIIHIYGLQDELEPEVDDKAVTVHRVYDSREDVPESMNGSNYVLTLQDVVKSLISYAVGCMFGRFSLDSEGLVCADEVWDSSKYISYLPHEDNIIPISDDEYFPDDIVVRFEKFIETVYGKDTLEENLEFIAAALRGRGGTSREVIRNYFINNFFSDHCKTYQKCPIYWLFDSGKKNGFKALIYMHRYQQDILARMRTDYIHEHQARYRTAIGDVQQRINCVSMAERVKMNKRLIKLREQAEELRSYEEKIHHLADQFCRIDLDDGVKHNYGIFREVLAKIR